MSRSRRCPKMGAISYAKMIALLAEGIYTCNEIAEELGLHVLTVWDYTRALYKEGCIHIAAWEKDARGHESIRVYKLGPGKDARKNLVNTARAQAQRRRRAAIREMTHAIVNGVPMQ